MFSNFAGQSDYGLAKFAPNDNKKCFHRVGCPTCTNTNIGNLEEEDNATSTTVFCLVTLSCIIWLRCCKSADFPINDYIEEVGETSQATSDPEHEGIEPEMARFWCIESIWSLCKFEGLGNFFTINIYIILRCESEFYEYKLKKWNQLPISDHWKK